jgi:hypothetical protein
MHAGSNFIALEYILEDDAAPGWIQTTAKREHVSACITQAYTTVTITSFLFQLS